MDKTKLREEFTSLANKSYEGGYLFGSDSYNRYFWYEELEDAKEMQNFLTKNNLNTRIVRRKNPFPVPLWAVDLIYQEIEDLLNPV